jgi:trk system potassium uptake protein TrkH
MPFSLLSRLRRRLQTFWLKRTPSQIFVGSFLLLIGLGTLGLLVLPGLYTGPPLHVIDALFTATSAVCVTGLIVVDTATYFTTWGQAFLLLLIQLGGLGIITFTSYILMSLGARLPLHHESLSRSPADIAPHVDYASLGRNVVRFTLGLELLGALSLYLLWLPRFGSTDALWPAIFHAVSAFCNAGFSTFSDSLMGFQQSPFTLLVVMGLVVLGGIGFLTLEESYVIRVKRPARRIQLSLHSRIVLTATAVLLVVGWILFTLFEWQVTLAGLPWWDRLTNGLFMSVTTRTAGFNTIDYAQATDGSNFLTMLLMAVGGSPSSTAGGLKTTTIAIIGLVALSRVRGYDATLFHGRTIPPETVQRAIGLFVFAFGVVAIAILVLSASEIEWAPAMQTRGQFLRHMFEAVSAFNTVGLSMGATGDLSGLGRMTTIVLMFIGRVGPLTFAAALLTRRRLAKDQFRYAYEDVAIG